jgi:hypothetical protein
MTKKLKKLSPVERLHRSYEALSHTAQNDGGTSRIKAAADVLSGALVKALRNGADRDVMVNLFAEEMGVSREEALAALRPYLRGATSKTKTSAEPINPFNPGPQPVPTHKPDPVKPNLTSGLKDAVPTGIKPEPLPSLPRELKPKDGQMPPTPAFGTYRTETRADGQNIYVMHGSRYSLLPGIDPEAPFGRYIDGRPMNEWGGPVGEGPPVIHGSNFVGENY